MSIIKQVLLSLCLAFNFGVHQAWASDTENNGTQITDSGGAIESDGNVESDKAIEPRFDLKQLCAQTLSRYALYRDALDAENYAAQFTEGGEFVTPGPSFKGRNALRGYIHSQPVDLRTMHHVTSFEITATGPATASGISYVLVHFSERKQGPADINRIAGALYEDEFEVIDGSCLIKQRTLRILMDHQMKTH